jgi:hypothetical protein
MEWGSDNDKELGARFKTIYLNDALAVARFSA